MNKDNLTDKQKRLFEDGQSIAQIAELEIDELLRKNKLYLKSRGINVNQQKQNIGIALSIIILQLIHLDVVPELVPETLRICANSLDIMLQNRKRD